MSELVKVTLAAPGHSFSGEAPPAIAAAIAKLVERAEAAAESRRAARLEQLARDKADALTARAAARLKAGDGMTARRHAEEALGLAPDHRGAAAVLAKLAPKRRRKGR